MASFSNINSELLEKATSSLQRYFNKLYAPISSYAQASEGFSPSNITSTMFSSYYSSYYGGSSSSQQQFVSSDLRQKLRDTAIRSNSFALCDVLKQILLGYASKMLAISPLLPDIINAGVSPSTEVKRLVYVIIEMMASRREKNLQKERVLGQERRRFHSQIAAEDGRMGRGGTLKKDDVVKEGFSSQSAIPVDKEAYFSPRITQTTTDLSAYEAADRRKSYLEKSSSSSARFNALEQPLFTSSLVEDEEAFLDEDIFLLAVNLLQRDLRNRNPLVRTAALRTLLCLKIPDLPSIILPAVERGIVDSVPYVRKLTASRLLSLHLLDADLHDHLVEMLLSLLMDVEIEVVCTALMALQVFVLQGKVNLSVFNPFFRRICEVLRSVHPFGQFSGIDLLHRYCRISFADPKCLGRNLNAHTPKLKSSFATKAEALATPHHLTPVSKDFALCIDTMELLLHSQSAAVVVAASSAIFDLTPLHSTSRRKTVIPLIRCAKLGDSIELQLLIWKSLYFFLVEDPDLFLPFLPAFFMNGKDHVCVKIEKVRILGALCCYEPEFLQREDRLSLAESSRLLFPPERRDPSALNFSNEVAKTADDVLSPSRSSSRVLFGRRREAQPVEEGRRGYFPPSVSVRGGRELNASSSHTSAAATALPLTSNLSKAVDSTEGRALEGDSSLNFSPLRQQQTVSKELLQNPQKADIASTADSSMFASSFSYRATSPPNIASATTTHPQNFPPNTTSSPPEMPLTNPSTAFRPPPPPPEHQTKIFKELFAYLLWPCEPPLLIQQVVTSITSIAIRLPRYLYPSLKRFISLLSCNSNILVSACIVSVRKLIHLSYGNDSVYVHLPYSPHLRENPPGMRGKQCSHPNLQTSSDAQTHTYSNSESPPHNPLTHQPGYPPRGSASSLLPLGEAPLFASSIGGHALSPEREGGGRSSLDVRGGGAVHGGGGGGYNTLQGGKLQKDMREVSEDFSAAMLSPIITFLGRTLEDLTDSSAKASAIWLLGTYQEEAGLAVLDILRKLIKEFETEPEVVQDQTMLLAVKLWSFHFFNASGSTGLQPALNSDKFSSISHTQGTVISATFDGFDRYLQVSSTASHTREAGKAQQNPSFLPPRSRSSISMLESMQIFPRLTSLVNYVLSLAHKNSSLSLRDSARFYKAAIAGTLRHKSKLLMPKQQERNSRENPPKARFSSSVSLVGSWLDEDSSFTNEDAEKMTAENLQEVANSLNFSVSSKVAYEDVFSSFSSSSVLSSSFSNPSTQHSLKDPMSATPFPPSSHPQQTASSEEQEGRNKVLVEGGRIEDYTPFCVEGGEVKGVHDDATEGTAKIATFGDTSASTSCVSPPLDFIPPMETPLRETLPREALPRKLPSTTPPPTAPSPTTTPPTAPRESDKAALTFDSFCFFYLKNLCSSIAQQNIRKMERRSEDFMHRDHQKEGISRISGGILDVFHSFPLKAKDLGGFSSDEVYMNRSEGIEVCAHDPVMMMRLRFGGSIPSPPSGNTVMIDIWLSLGMRVPEAARYPPFCDRDTPDSVRDVEEEPQNTRNFYSSEEYAEAQPRATASSILPKAETLEDLEDFYAAKYEEFEEEKSEFEKGGYSLWEDVEACDISENIHTAATPLMFNMVNDDFPQEEEVIYRRNVERGRGGSSSELFDRFPTFSDDSDVEVSIEVPATDNQTPKEEMRIFKGGG